jgi:plastocyanin
VVEHYQPRVTIIDNDGTFAPGDPGTGQWGYAPAHITVAKGESIVFNNPTGNFRPHTVTSITWTGAFPNRTLAPGALFNSSPDTASILMPGQSFTLSTADLEPGHYLYYCGIHPWMAGSFTVTP